MEKFIQDYKSFLFIFIIVIQLFNLSCNSSSSSSDSDNNYQDQVFGYRLDGTLTKPSGDPIIDTVVEIPSLNESARTDSSGAFNFDLKLSKEQARSLRLVFQHENGLLSSVNIDLGAYLNSLVRFDFIYNQDNGETIIENVTEESEVMMVDSLLKCSIEDLSCGRDEFCFFAEGECGESANGICRQKPEICIELFAPVCGCDGKTYSNDCKAAANGISVKHLGSCENS